MTIPASATTLLDPAPDGELVGTRSVHTQQPPGGTNSWVIRPSERLGRDRSASGPQFSARESEILLLLTQGLSNQQIADATYLSINSIKTYIRNVYRKIGVRTRVQALLWALDHGVRPNGVGKP